MWLLKSRNESYLILQTLEGGLDFLQSQDKIRSGTYPASEYVQHGRYPEIAYDDSTELMTRLQLNNLDL